MTVKQYIRKNGWNLECDTDNTYRCMNVDITFINSEGNEDETEFSIKAWNVNELSSLFDNFCKENGFKNNTVTGISVIETAETMNELS